MSKLKPWLWLPVKLAHDLSAIALQIQAAFLETNVPVWRPLEWRGLNFPNPLGLAGGLDKDAELVEEWWKLGAGFIEVGTVTPLPQGANSGRIMDRDLGAQALWNRMGFPGSGVRAVRENLLDLTRPWPTPIFVNIGKNRQTPNEQAHRDYTSCISQLSGLADAFVINISSPNTAQLRDLLLAENLHAFLSEVLRARDRYAPTTPLLLKISPDMSNFEIEATVPLALALGINGIIATNTTLARSPDSRFPADGGVSGQPLALRAKEVLRILSPLLGEEHLLVSVGGVMSTEDVFERLDLGADLVQIYTALIYQGPGFFKSVARVFS
jgi:dihydroorotate dehydrogenase